ncbi:histone methylation protein DOT1-domain-containing protein [Pterulicium gracile]|uniref:Histone-lysine N-methyltransferase, H3 lysine-79 specific n=1 Tax=Pterulicium gracile TaxID=1884261 RepID=A0A5C3QWI0_9AGAR|nr:histone methylation protein DOT1-domain-containing protein [Pterula gracilis]
MQGLLPSEHENLSLPSSSRSCSRPDTPGLLTSRSGSSHPSSAGSDSTPALSRGDWTCRDEPVDDLIPAYSAADVVRRLRKMYKPYFKNHENPHDEMWGPEADPTVELEFPNDNATERYILLAPKDKDHYNPIMCLESSLYTIVQFYLTEKQRSFFGPIPTAILCDADTPPDSPPTPDDEPFTKSRSRSLKSKPNEPDEGYRLLIEKLKEAKRSPPKLNYLRTLQRAINTFDGPLFLHTLGVINSYLRFLKYPPLPSGVLQTKLSTNYLKKAVRGFPSDALPKDLLMRVLEENYQRSVGPNVPALRKYEAFSSKVYGELMPSLAYDIIADAGLTEDSVFVDLGSGVANVVVQASLQTGCYSFGVEIMKTAAEVGEASVKNFEKRCRMWGLNVGKMETEHNDMMQSSRLDELIPKADLLLVDNKVFKESLNEALRPKFLDLKEGAIVVSLAPFVSNGGGRVTERNLDDISAILDVTEKQYHSGSVSWGNGGGTYYVHRIDRAGYAKNREQYERLRDSSTPTTRATRSRR